MNIPSRSTAICITILITLSMSILSAQEPEQIPRQLYVLAPESSNVESIDIEAGMERRREQSLHRYLLTAVAEFTEVVVVEQLEDADCTLSTVLEYSPEGVSFQFILYDLFFDRELTAWETTLPHFSLKELFPALEEEGVAQIRQHLPLRDPEIVEIVTEKVVEEVEVQKVYVEAKGVEVAIEGIPGTTLITTAGEIYQLGETGTLVLDLPTDSYFEFEATLQGFYPETVGVVIESDPVVVSIDLVKAARWGIDIGFVLHDVALAPAVQFFYKPNWGYLSFRITQNFLSLVTLLTELSTQAQPSLFFIEPSLGTGWYFFSPSSPIRIGVGAELSTRIVFPDAVAPYISRIKPIALALGATADFSPFKKVRFHAGWHPTFFYRFTELLLYDPDQYIPGLEGIRLFGGLHLNLVSFTIGARVLL